MHIVCIIYIYHNSSMDIGLVSSEGLLKLPHPITSCGSETVALQN